MPQEGYSRDVSWLRRTGQTWKFVIFWLGMLPGGLWGARIGLRDFRWTLVSLGVFAWFMLSVRCPRCRGRVAWYAATKLPFREFDVALWRDGRCPICNDGIEQPVRPPLFSSYRQRTLSSDGTTLPPGRGPERRG